MTATSDTTGVGATAVADRHADDVFRRREIGSAMPGRQASFTSSRS